jgi:cysteinyl-tRNA synthetase
MQTEQYNTRLTVYNTLSRKKEVFEAIDAPYVGMYVCGPTVYGDAHLGNCRTFTGFDIIYRYLKHLGYKVRYVRNLTDVGHLLGDENEGEDRILKKARLEKIEPMEVVQRYTNGFHDIMLELNNIPPSIEPTATGHIMEQIEMTEKLLEKGLAYEVNGSVYFDVKKYHEQYKSYGELSGRIIEDMLAGHRELDGQSEKRDAIDFALWKSASKEHLMRWNSPWGEGFPGWHIECSVMSTKYLGKTFDIHGGGMDLQFPHHECEIAQAVGTYGQSPVKYWLHTNMLTMNGQKMSKSVGNVVMPTELFTGEHELLSEAYSAMVLRFFILQTHYRSTMDMSNDALKAAKTGYKKLMNALRVLKNITYEADASVEKDVKITKQIEQNIANLYRGMNDDFNTARALATLFNLSKVINRLHLEQIQTACIEKETFDLFKNTFITFIEDVLGLQEEKPELTGLIDTLIDFYREAKEAKNYEKVDEIRAKAKQFGIVFKDMKTKIDWAYEE